MALNLTDVVRVVITWAGPLSSVAQNVFHYKVVSGSGIDEATALASAVGSWAGAIANLSSIIASDWTAGEAEMLKWDFTNNRWDGVASQSFTPVGGVSGADPEPHGVCGVVSIFTELPRRQGRSFVPGMIESQNTNGEWIAGAVTSLGLYGADLDDDITPAGGTLRFGTFNTTTGSPFFETFSEAIGSVVASSLPGYQRRRKPLVGM